MKRSDRHEPYNNRASSVFMLLGFGMAAGMAFAALSLVVTHSPAGMCIAFIVGFSLGAWYICEKTASDAHSQDELIKVCPGDTIACDGEAVEGAALVDEAAIAGVSLPAFIEAGSKRNCVIAGGVVIEGSLTIRCRRRLQ
jgi:hypothetical protein